MKTCSKCKMTEEQKKSRIKACRKYNANLTEEQKQNKRKWRKEYREKNKEKIAEYQKEYQEEYRKQPLVRIVRSLRSRIRNVLKGTNKSAGIFELIGIADKENPIEFLWQYLEKQFKSDMTRDNYGNWHIDHIIPCTLFDLTDPEQQKICFHYSNLQPLWAEDNLKKGCKLECA